MLFHKHTGHFVQVFKPLAADYYRHDPPRGPHDSRRHPNYVTVEGRTTTRSATSLFEAGWQYMSRELPRKRAIKFAKAYRNAGFRSRVVLRTNDGKCVTTDEFMVR